MKKYLVLILQLLLLCGCGGDSGQNPAGTNPPSKAVVDYVASFDLPLQQEIVTVLVVPEQNVGVYNFSYGEPQDCPAGCIYSYGTILQHNDKIGWLDGAMVGEDPAGSNYSYDFDAADDYLFSADFHQKIADAFGCLDYGPLMYLLAGDPDTPKPVLLDYAEWISVQRGLGYLARCLLNNPAVQIDPDILTIIAGMDESFSEYTDYILAARAYLAVL